VLPPRWTLDHYVALLNLACAVAVVVGAVVLGTSAPTLRDAAVPLLLGLIVVVVLLRWAVRSWRDGNRRAERAASPPPPVPAADPPPLSPEGKREVARVVTVLADFGVFAPHAPDPADLHGPVADQGEPVTTEAVLNALHEAAYYAPDFDAAAYSANLAFQESHVEQFADVLQEQIDELVRLAGGGLADLSTTVQLTDTGTPRVPTRIRLRVGAGEQVLTYTGADKYLSTVVHEALARILRERGTGRRLAWLWNDQGVWLTGLPDGALDDLNAALGAGDGWRWVDEEEPVAAGELYPR
jgi:hypothetical protein